MDCYKEEIFGPVLVCLEVTSFRFSEGITPLKTSQSTGIVYL